MEEQKRWEKSMNRINPALQYVEKIEEISDIKKVAQMLSSGEWIAICATTSEPRTFAMGKVTTLMSDS